jgi:hypothetical protein
MAARSKSCWTFRVMDAPRFVVSLLVVIASILSGEASASEIEIMDTNRFWNIVERAKGHGGEAGHTARLRKELKSLSHREVMEFVRHYLSFYHRAGKGDVWAAGMLLNGGHGTDDGFEYFRNWLIAQGRSVYESALVNPDSLAAAVADMTEDGPSAEWETYGYAGADIYSEKTGRNVYEDLAESVTSNAPATEEEDFDWAFYTDSVLASRLPRLWKKYGGFKQEADKKIARPSENEVKEGEKIEIAGLGTVAVGSIVQHKRFGPGKIESMDVHGPAGIVTAIIEFADGKHPMLLDGNSALWSLPKVTNR